MERLTIQGFDFDTNFVASNLQSWPIAQALKKLQAYEDAEELGRLVWLPCKVGDTVWLLVRGGIEPWNVYAITQGEVGAWEMRLRSGMLSQRRPNEFEVCVRKFISVGKTVFLTREEAENEAKRIKRYGTEID